MDIGNIKKCKTRMTMYGLITETFDEGYYSKRLESYPFGTAVELRNSGGWITYWLNIKNFDGSWVFENDVSISKESFINCVKKIKERVDNERI